MAREIIAVSGAAVGFMIAGPQGAQYGFMAGSILGNIIDPPSFDGPQLGDAAVQTSRDGIPIPIGWGVTPVVGNIIQMNPIVETTKKSGGKKSGGTTKTTIRKRTFAIGIGRGINGPIDGLLRVWENNKLIYDVRDGSSFPADDNAAFLGATTMYLGTETQTADPELETESGVGNTPAFRGLAYIVFNNKDITNFGSSIPSYRFEIEACAAVAVSGSFSETEGYAATQYGWHTSDPNFQNPFMGESYSEFTISVVCKANVWPAWNFDRYTCNVQSVLGKGIYIRRRSAGDKVYMGFSFRDQVGARNVALKLHEISIDHPTWDWSDWYCMIASYSQPLNLAYTTLVNLTKGEEVTLTANIDNNVNVTWFDNTNDTPNSIVTWGGGSADVSDVINKWRGYISQLTIHNKYVDLTNVFNRRKFSALNGIIPLGAAGSLPYGERPLVYLPRGLPSGNLGTKFIGSYPSDFYVAGTETIDVVTPPVAS